MTETPTSFSKGEPVPKEGAYVCVPCGFHHTYKEGEHFAECTSCLSGTPDGKEEFLEGMEMWEPLPEEVPGEVEETKRPE